MHVMCSESHSKYVLSCYFSVGLLLYCCHLLCVSFVSTKQTDSLLCSVSLFEGKGKGKGLDTCIAPLT